MKKIHIIGGGTFSHVRSHLALAAPAFGGTARKLDEMFQMEIDPMTAAFERVANVQLHLTKMADASSNLVTNDDVSKLLDQLIADPETRVIILNAALCDYDGSVLDYTDQDSEADELARFGLRKTPSGKYGERLKTREGERSMALTPADKLVGKVRKTRKDIFLVAFKTTTGATPDEQYLAGLNLLKANSANLVVANDTVTRHNMIIAPEETRYHEGAREQCLRGLVEMVFARKDNTFTRSTVVDGAPVPFQTSELIPHNLRTVVNYLVAHGAYKPFRGATAGHFAVRLDEHNCLTSRRKTNYTVEGGLDLVKVEYDGLNKVIAHGSKPSVGGQSQRIVFEEHDGLDCIVHAHVPLRPDHIDVIPVAPQWQNECGSHQCGANTSRHLKPFAHGIHAVMLEGHGPNIVFSRETPAEEVIAFIERNFDLAGKTGGLVEQKVAEYA